MQKYYPVIILSTLFLALIIAQLIKQDFNRAGISALFMAIVCGILLGLTFVTDTITAWMLMSIFVIMIVLFSVARSDVLNIYTPEVVDMTACKSGSEEKSASEEESCVPPVKPKPTISDKCCIDPCDQCGECLTSCYCEEGFVSTVGGTYPSVGKRQHEGFVSAIGGTYPSVGKRQHEGFVSTIGGIYPRLGSFNQAESFKNAPHNFYGTA